MEIQKISPLEVTIVAAVYIVVWLIAMFIAKYTSQSSNFFHLFTKNTPSIIFLYMLVIIAVSIALSILPYLTLVVVPLVFLVGVLTLAFKLGQKKVTTPVAAMVTLLLLMLTAPVILSLVYGSHMNNEAKISSFVLVGLFWLVGSLLMLYKPFSNQVMPRSLTRPLLTFILLTFIVILNAGGAWASIVVFVLSLLIGFVWWLKSGDKVLSVSINTYQKSPTEVATAAVSLVFLTITTFVFLVRKPKEPKLEGEVPAKTYVSPSTSIVAYTVFGLMCAFIVYVSITNIVLAVGARNNTKDE